MSLPVYSVTVTVQPEKGPEHRSHHTLHASAPHTATSRAIKEAIEMFKESRGRKKRIHHITTTTLVKGARD